MLMYLLNGTVTRFVAALGTGTCDKTRTFFLLKPWYFYSKFNAVDCSYTAAKGDSFSGADIWPIMAVMFEDLLIVAAYVAVVYVLIGGFQIMTAQGEPDRFKNGRGTVINALIGLVIALTAGRLVGFVFHGIFK